MAMFHLSLSMSGSLRVSLPERQEAQDEPGSLVGFLWTSIEPGAQLLFTIRLFTCVSR